MTLHSALRKIASRRDELRAYNSHNRPLSKDYEYVGLVGEDEFGIEFDLPVNLSLKRNGDGGIDFRCNGYTIDVKTLRDDKFLKIELGRCRADIYVLYHYIDNLDTAAFCGWEYGSCMAKIPAVDTGRGIINHALEREFLNDKLSLYKLLGKGYKCQTTR
jgi:hypothetical protein